MSDVSPASSSSSFSEAAIFSRVVESSGELSPALAEHVLSLQISEEDQERTRVLLERNAAGTLTGEEQIELENFNHIANLISLWKSRARRVLNSS